MSGLTKVDRARMAVADIGLDPSDVKSTGNGRYRTPASWPDDLMWRLEQTVHGVPARRAICLACYCAISDRRRSGEFVADEAARDALFARCSARLPFTKDCGVDR